MPELNMIKNEIQQDCFRVSNRYLGLTKIKFLSFICKKIKFIDFQMLSQTKRISSILLSCLIVLCLPSCVHEKHAVKRPNVILIYADDLGFGDLGVYGQNKIETPNIDHLAANGMMFKQFYTGAPVCAPSRCILLTGMHSGHAAVRGNDEAGYRGDVWNYRSMALDSSLEGQSPMPDSAITIAEVLRASGYRTGLIGKWGLGYPGSESTPNKQGFEYFFGFNCQRQAHTYYPLHLWENEYRVHLKNDTIAPGTKLRLGLDTLDAKSYTMFDQTDYAPDLMFDALSNWVESVKNESFFLYWATPIPHLPLQAPKRWVDYYIKKFGDELPYTAQRAGYFPSRYPHATYAAMVSYLDENIGKLVSQLQQVGILDNTIILFTSDNGPSYTAGVDSPWFESGGPFKSDYGWGKGFLREGGIRVPFIAQWKGKIKASTVSDHMASMQDLFSTILDLTGEKGSNTINDGISLAPTLLDMGDQKTHEYLYWEYPEYGGQRAVRMGDWKVYNKDLISKGDTSLLLYHLPSDLQEQNDLAKEYPEKIAKAKQIFLNEHTPSTNPRWRFPVLDGH